jgi:PAS domain S-box-containing protein
MNGRHGPAAEARARPGGSARGERTDSAREARLRSEALRLTDARLELLTEAIDRAQSARTVDALMEIVRSAARRLSGADGVTIVLRDGDQCHYVDEEAVSPLWKGQRFPLISCISGWAMLNGQTAIVPDVYADGRIPHQAYRPTFVKSLVMVPVGGEEKGAAIGAYWSEVRAPGPEEVAVLEALARSTGTALRNLELLASLSESVVRAEQLHELGQQELLERRRAEAELQAAHQHTSEILESIADGFYAVDHEWRLTYVNRRAEELWRRPREELIGVRLWDLFPDPEASESYRLHMEASRERRVVRGELVSDLLGCWISIAIYPHRDGLSVYLRDISERKRADEERELLARELSHRVKNILAVVQALARQTESRDRSVEAFREAFLGRLRALARAHDLLLEAQWRSADLRPLVERALEAYRIDCPACVAIEGEGVALEPSQGLGLSLVLHELGANAAKYGALSRAEGRVEVSWRIEQDARGRRVRLRWQESCGPRVEEPRATGFGTRLIKRASTYELGGEVALDYARSGLRCEVVFPLS